MLANLRYSLPMCLALALPWVSPTSAATIDLSNNLNQANTNINSINNALWQAQAFTTDATHTTVTSVTTKFSHDNDTSGTLNLYIYSSASNKPSSPVASIGSYNIDSQLTSSLADYTLSSLNVGLSANTQYFLVLGGASVVGG